MTRLALVVGNKNYSSWSMRPWVLLRQASIAFEEIQLWFDQDAHAKGVERYSPTGLVPVLLVDGAPASSEQGSGWRDATVRESDLTSSIAGAASVSGVTSPIGGAPVPSFDRAPVWDSLAICETIADLFPEKKLWPDDLRARSFARSICAEMHAGFRDLRGAMPVNIRARHPGKGMNPAVRKDIDRVVAIWQACRESFGGKGEMLFGDFGVADAFYAPVVMRFATYAVELPPVAQAYADAVHGLSAVKEWMAAARRETAFVAADEPYADVKREA